jgi:hypothetical protein
VPLLNDADEVYKGAVRVDRVYKGTTLVWPKVETWSPWYMVGDAVLAAPAAWFAAGISHNYDTGAHEQTRWRYSNLGRVHYRGLMKNVSASTLAAGTFIIGCNINDPNVPKPGDLRMGSGVGAQAYAGVWNGGFFRYDAAAYEYHHKVNLAAQDAVAIPVGSWFAIDHIFAFSADT